MSGSPSSAEDMGGGGTPSGSPTPGRCGSATSATPREREGGSARQHNAWTRDKMVAFLRELAATQSVAAAARGVGVSRQSAYRLKNRLPATPFALGWEVALEAGFAQLAHAMMERAIHGVEVPHYYQGELLGTSRHFDERLAIWIANNPWKVGRQQIAREFSSEGFDRLMERIEFGPLDWGGDCAADGDGAGYVDTPPGLEDFPATPEDADKQQSDFFAKRSWYAALAEQEDKPKRRV